MQCPHCGKPVVFETIKVLKAPPKQTCDQCHAEFHAERKEQRFCSPKCRKAFVTDAQHVRQPARV